MSKRIKKGKAYERFSQFVLMLKNINWDYDDKHCNIHFDIDTGEHVIYGISGAHHQIDVHLKSSQNPEYHLLCECKAHNPAVEKTHACSFVTVIKDIQSKNPDWKIIPVFTADDGYQSGASKILKYYNIINLEMKDYRNAFKTFTIHESSIYPIFGELFGVLEDQTLVDKSVTFENLDLGGGYGLSNVINIFALYDENGKPITDLINHIGKFHTGERVFGPNNEYDYYYDTKTNKKLIGVQGTVLGNTTTDLGTSKSIIQSQIITRIKVGDGRVYKINKDGTINLE